MKKNSFYAMLLGAGILLFLGGVFRDIFVYVNGGRPCFATIDCLCGIFFHANRSNLIAKMPIVGDQVRLTVSHVWRGKYQFRVWVPETIEGFVSPIEMIGMDCSFFDKEGNEVYINKTPPSVNLLWSKMSYDGSQGSDLAFRMYLAPDDVPLDDELTVNVKFCGQFNKFYAAHTNACLVLVKERDK